MEFTFSAEVWTRLTHEQQAERCRVMVQEANALARSATASDPLRHMYYELALHWKNLASEIESAAGEISNGGAPTT
jgi:hypothetical protein